MPLFALAAGAVGAIYLTKLARREWRRVNHELDRVDPARVGGSEPASVGTLRRDPATGEYSVTR